MEFDTGKCKSDGHSSLLLSLKDVLHVYSFLNLNLSICCAWKDSTQNSSKIQDKIFAVSCCWKSEKLGFVVLITTPCKNKKRLRGIQRRFGRSQQQHNSTQRRCKWKLRVITEREIWLKLLQSAETLKGSIYVACISLVQQSTVDI